MKLFAINTLPELPAGVSYAPGFLAVPTVINTVRDGAARIIGFCHASDKEQVAIRFDCDVLAAFRAAGPGWQTRMNDALRGWLKTHSPA